MKKGELKKTQILETAEFLFVERGYERTSIQDILDALSLSKGGFYHHFPSKEAILLEICENRASARFDRIGLELFGARISPMEKLNVILRMVNLFDREEPRFAALLLKLCYLDGDVRMREHMRQIVLERLKPYADDVIAAGIASGDLYARHPDKIGEIVLNMAANADDAAYRLLTDERDNPECFIDIADLLNAYRDAVEALLGAPYASLTLFDPIRMMADYRAIAVELKKMEI